MLFSDPLMPFGERDLINDFVYQNRDSRTRMLMDSERDTEPQDLRALLNEYQNIGNNDLDSDSASDEVKSEDNIVFKNREKRKGKMTWL